MIETACADCASLKEIQKYTQSIRNTWSLVTMAMTSKPFAEAQIENDAQLFNF